MLAVMNAVLFFLGAMFLNSPGSAGSTARRVAGPGAITSTGRLRVNTASNRRRVNRQLARQGSPQRFTTTGYLR